MLPAGLTAAAIKPIPNTAPAADAWVPTCWSRGTRAVPTSETAAPPTSAIPMRSITTVRNSLFMARLYTRGPRVPRGQKRARNDGGEDQRARGGREEPRPHRVEKEQRRGRHGKHRALPGGWRGRGDVPHRRAGGGRPQERASELRIGARQGPDRTPSRRGGRDQDAQRRVPGEDRWRRLKLRRPPAWTTCAHGWRAPTSRLHTSPVRCRSST